MQDYIEKIYEELQAIRETLEILQDEELMKVINESMEALQNSDTISLEEARRILGLE